MLSSPLDSWRTAHTKPDKYRVALECKPAQRLAGCPYDSKPALLSPLIYCTADSERQEPAELCKVIFKPELLPQPAWLGCATSGCMDCTEGRHAT